MRHRLTPSSTSSNATSLLFGNALFLASQPDRSSDSARFAAARAETPGAALRVWLITEVGLCELPTCLRRAE